MSHASHLASAQAEGRIRAHWYAWSMANTCSPKSSLRKLDSSPLINLKIAERARGTRMEVENPIKINRMILQIWDNYKGSLRTMMVKLWMVTI
jgi:hypothetical protein